MNIRMNYPETFTESDSESESAEDVLSAFKEEIAALAPAIETIGSQINGITERIRLRKNLFTDPVSLVDSSVQDWCIQKGLGKTFSISEFIDTLFRHATLDTETRSIVFPTGFPVEQVTLFELVRLLPSWFSI
jgi:hypothetical protein